MAASLLPQPKQIFQTDAWAPGIGYQIFTYSAGTLTAKATYTDSALASPNTNPVIANARGEVSMFGNGAYRLIVKDSNGSTVYDQDNIESGGSIASALRAELLAATGSTIVGTIQTGVGAVLRTLQAKARDVFSTADYGTLAQAKTAAGNSPVVDPVGVVHKDTFNNLGNIFAESGEAIWQSAAIQRSSNNLTPHLGIPYAASVIEMRSTGSTGSGPLNANYGQIISNIKQNWMTTAVQGEIDGMYIITRNGGGTQSDNAAILVDAAQRGASGFCAVLESHTTLVDATGTATKKIDCQVGVLNDRDSSSVGFYANAMVGTMLDAVLVANTPGAGNWTYYFRGVRDSVVNYAVDNAGMIQQFPVGSSVNTTKTENAAGRWHVKNHSNVEMMGADQAGNFVAGDYPSAPISYAPTISSAIGGFTSASIVSAFYIRRGSLMFVDIFFNVATPGSAAGAIIFSMPTATTGRAFANGSGYISGGKSMQSNMAGSASTVQFNLYDGTTPCTTSGAGHVSFYYESL